MGLIDWARLQLGLRTDVAGELSSCDAERDSVERDFAYILGGVPWKIRLGNRERH